MKKILGVLALFFFIALNKTTIKAEESNCGLIRSFQNQGILTDALAALPNGYLVVKSYERGLISIWDTDEASLALTIHTYFDFSLVVLPDGNLTSGAVGKLNIFNTTDGSLLSTIHTESFFVPKAFALLENGYLAAGGEKLDVIEIEIWQFNNKTLVNKIITSYSNTVKSLAYVGSGLLASTDGNQNSIEIWNVTSGQLENTLDGHADAVNFLLTLKNGSLVSGSSDNTIKFLDANSGKLLNTWTGHSEMVNSLAEFRDMGLLASGGDDGIRVWDLSNGKLLAYFNDTEANHIVALANGSLATENGLYISIWNVKDCV